MMDRYFPTDVIPIIDVSLDVYIGQIYNQEGRPEELKRRLERIQARKDLKIEDEIMIGQVYFNELNDIDAFIDYYEKLHEKHPLYSEILYSLVQAYTQVERSDEARDILERWINFHPNDSQAVEWLSILNNLHN
jgi:tetratricopeptide (TPR) repeat protein